ncbi:MAG: hypothetical protein ACO1SV_03745 [Fimbriimonas sp.]
MQRLSQEPRFDDAAQRQIISLAAELQRHEQEGATLADLETRAREAGIDPKYVRQALGHVVPPVPQIAATPTLASSDRNWFQNNELSFLSVGAFGIAQVVSIVGFMQRGMLVFPVALVLAFVMGLAFSRTTSHRFGAVAALVGSTIATVTLTLLVHALGLTWNTLKYSWADDVFACLGLEFITLLLGFLVAAGARWLRRLHRPHPNG